MTPRKKVGTVRALAPVSVHEADGPVELAVTVQRRTFKEQMAAAAWYVAAAMCDQFPEEHIARDGRGVRTAPCQKCEQRAAKLMQGMDVAVLALVQAGAAARTRAKTRRKQ